MIVVGDISTRLLDARQDAARIARLDTVREAWRVWRAGVIEAMHARVTSVGNGPDNVLADLEAEMLHIAWVGSALAVAPEEIWINHGGRQ